MLGSQTSIRLSLTDVQSGSEQSQFVHLAAYGTYVEHRYQGSMVTTDCSEDSVIMLKVLVFSSWVMISFNWYVSAHLKGTIC